MNGAGKTGSFLLLPVILWLKFNGTVDVVVVLGCFLVGLRTPVLVGLVDGVDVTGGNWYHGVVLGQGGMVIVVVVVGIAVMHRLLILVFMN